MIHVGRCYCGAIRFEAEGDAQDVSICHCQDCRRHAGAPLVAWAGFAASAVKVTQGLPRTIQLTGPAVRSFCADCGTGLFYENAAVAAGVVEIQSALFDDAEAFVPTMQIHCAERLTWTDTLPALPAYARCAE